MKRTIEFTKMHGAGNDYVYVNTMEHPLQNPEQLSIAWSNRNKGIGGDGLILIGASEKGDFSMRIFNNDGSEARMCGNGSRCVGKYLYDKGLTRKTTIALETLSGIKILRLHIGKDGAVDSVTVDMGEPGLSEPSQLATPDGGLREGKIVAEGQEAIGTFVSMGNPHFVVFVDDAEQCDVAGRGKRLERTPIFPERCNIEFAEVRSPRLIRARVWERGSGITMACGTGACATAVAAILTGRCERKTDIEMDGGVLSIEWNEKDNHVYMTGPAAFVFDGKIEIEEADKTLQE